MGTQSFEEAYIEDRLQDYTDTMLKECNNDVLTEVGSSLAKYGHFSSPHEGYAVILEEVEELWDEIKAKRGYTQAAYDEAKQIAAMALVYMTECYKHANPI
jgi:hypothetical protein